MAEGVQFLWGGGGLTGLYIVLQSPACFVIKHQVQNHEMAFKGNAVDSKVRVVCHVLAYTSIPDQMHVCVNRDRLKGNHVR